MNSFKNHKFNTNFSGQWQTTYIQKSLKWEGKHLTFNSISTKFSRKSDNFIRNSTDRWTEKVYERERDKQSISNSITHRFHSLVRFSSSTSRKIATIITMNFCFRHCRMLRVRFFFAALVCCINATIHIHTQKYTFRYCTIQYYALTTKQKRERKENKTQHCRNREQIFQSDV